MEITPPREDMVGRGHRIGSEVLQQTILVRESVVPDGYGPCIRAYRRDVG
jgi:hypothetical protein